MSHNNFRKGRLLAPVLLGGLLLAFQHAWAEETCATASCHAGLLKPKNVHAATESCGNCHESTATPHPQAGKKTFKLSSDAPALCNNCHDEFGKKKDVHPPVKDGMCTTCHDPHASNEPKLLAQPQKELCAMCHEDKSGAKVPHGPVAAGDCTACHVPHESDIKPLLVKEGDALCSGCHEDMQVILKKKFVHDAVSAGCTSCHNPHGTDHPKLLAEEGPKLCFGCHDSISEIALKSPVVHAALKDAKGCANCHSPHASDQAKLLLKPQKDLCLGCHKMIVTKNMTTLHGPIAEGKCTPCHDPHGGRYPKLLVKDYPADSYVPYTDTSYALCFDCHKRDLLQYPDTSFATNFRDGERNLHYLHVNNKQKGRSCGLCHNLHGSANPKLIADSVPFGKWSLPLKYVKTETGGQCSPGCHKTYAYDRQVPGRKPEAPKAAPKGK
jgi:predicted CXXCH cytochrome family protein